MTGTARQTNSAGLTKAQAEVAAFLFTHLKWPIRELPLGPDDVMLTEKAFMPFLREAGILCDVQDIATTDPSSLSKANRVYVLLRDGELNCVRRYNAESKRQHFVSATYEDFRGWPLALQNRRVTLLMATQHSGVTYLSDMLPENGFCRPISLMTEGQKLWSLLQTDFDPIRASRTTLHRAQISADHIGDIVLHADPSDFAAMHSRGQMHEALLGRLIQHAGAQALYFVRRNKAEQAVVAESLRAAALVDAPNDTSAPAINTPRELSSLKKKMRAALPEPCVSDVRDRMFELLSAEGSVEPLMQKATKLRMLTFEELFESPVEAMKALGPFLGQQRMRKIRVVDGRAEMMTAPWFEQMLVKVRQDMVAFLNLERTEAGSFTTPTLKLLDTDGR